MNTNIIWGTVCECGTPCFELQSKNHPWSNTSYIANLICPNCRKENHVDRELASEFYSNKIYQLFENIKGSVIDFGCGGGFLTYNAYRQEDTTDLYAVDVDDECSSQINKISENITFIHGSFPELATSLGKCKIDELISRDVIMFIDDPKKFIQEISSLISHRIRILAWFMPDSKRAKNQVSPEEIREMLEAENWKVKLLYPDWYAYGYFIDAHR